MYKRQGIGKAQLFPQDGEQPGVTDRQRRGERDVARAVFKSGLASGTQQAIDQRIGLAGAHGFEAPQGGDDALAREPALSR